MTLPDQKPSDGKVTTTITLPKETADDVKAAALRAGVGWTQMMAVLIRQALDAQNRPARLPQRSD